MANQWPGLHDSIIKTERLLLRPLSFDYMPGIFAHRSNPRIVHWKKPHTELEETREWVEERLANPKSWNFVIHYLPAEWRDKEPDASWLIPSKHDQDDILGRCGVHNPPELGYAFNPEVWGKGLATEAIRGMIEAYWETFPNGHPAVGDEERTYLMAYTEKSNLASEKVLRKNGFEFWKEKEDDEPLNAKGEEKEEKMLNVWRLWKPGFDGKRDEPEAEKERGSGP